MKQHIKSLTLACLITCGGIHLLNAEEAKSVNEQQTKEINWLTDYEKAKALAKKESKPLFLYFTGSDWCSWCKKMDSEILSTAPFQQALGDAFIFVKLDFPELTPLDPKLKKQNQELQKTFNVRGFPTIILLDPDLKQIATVGYHAGGGQVFATKVQKLLEAYSKKK